MVQVKICGISTPEALDAAIGGRANWCGLVFFPPSPRNLAPPAVRARFGLPVWKVVAVSSSADIARATDYRDAADLILFDAKTPREADRPGGMGLRFDWSLLAGYRGPLPWGLAGGLTPANVAEAIAATGAPLVDTSSGVESAPGVKEPALIESFCQAARST